MFCSRRIRHAYTIAALVLIGLVACQPVPQPFARAPDAPDNPLLRLEDRAGIVVLDVDGGPAAIARELPGATVKALHALNVPATTQSANTKSQFLIGQGETKSVRPGLLEVELAWELVGPKGASIGRHVVTGTASDAAWNAGSDKLVRRFAEDSARGVAAFIQSPPLRGPKPIKTLRPLYITDVTGVSDEQGSVLRRALSVALRRLKLSVQPVKRERDLVVVGRVSLGPAAAGRRRIEIAWSVREPDGAEIGNLKQANMIMSESMGEKWPELARMIAKAAAPGVVEVLRNSGPASDLTTHQILLAM